MANPPNSFEKFTVTYTHTYTINNKIYYYFRIHDSHERVTVDDDVQDNATDSPTQIGDVSSNSFGTGDHFHITGPNGTAPRIFAGSTSTQKGFAAFQANNGNYYAGFYSNGHYADYTGVRVSKENGAVTICFATGTSIRTARGEVAVEDLAIGDRVVTASGAERPIRWIGHHGYSGRFANANPDVLPVCFKAGALADNVPARDLWVSPKHAMYLDEVLIPAEHLVNGTSVVRAERVDEITYWHVELDSHDVLVSEGAPSESYVDDGNRGMFHNAHEFDALYPDAAMAEAIYCAPRVEDGYLLEGVRQRIARRTVPEAAAALAA